jgi:hypothetical protein
MRWVMLYMEGHAKIHQAAWWHNVTLEPCPTVNAQLSSFARTSAEGLRMAEAAAVVVVGVLLLLLGSVQTWRSCRAQRLRR